MSTMQRMTLIGFYNYLNSFERDLFANLHLPDGYDKSTFVNSLLLEHGEKCVMYTDPDFMVNAIGIWSDKYQLELEKIFEALTADYNPIWNYDRNEEWEDHGGHKIVSTTNAGHKLTSTTNAGHKLTSTTNAGHKAKDTPKYDDDVTNDYDVVNKQDFDATTEHKVSADNSSDYQPDYKDISNSGQTTTSNDGTIKRHIEGATQDLSESSNSKTEDQTTANSKTEDQTTDNSKTEDQQTDNTSHSGHLWGNIGVTTSAAMVSEVVRQRFNMTLYGITTKMFANELLLGIW